MTTTLQKQVAEPDEYEIPPGVIFDTNGVPVGAISLDEWITRLDRKLVAHFGEEFRIMLNESRCTQGLPPI
jgi:hypothetical protein